MHRPDVAERSDGPGESSAATLGGGRFRLLLLGGLTLLRPDGTEHPALVSRGRKLLLLAYLALAQRPLARDRLATFLWGHRDDERARHSLREALSALRQVLGATVPRGREMVSLAAHAPLDVDVIELRVAARAGDHARVVALYRGPFLDGVHVSDASEVEDWISEERRSIERIFVGSCAAECDRLAGAQDSEACAATARRWLEADPADTAAFIWRLRSLAAPGTPTALRGAIAEYERHAAVLLRDHDETPPAQARALRAELGDRLAQAPEPTTLDIYQPTVSAAVAAPAPSAMAAADVRERDRRRNWPSRSFIITAAAVIVMLAFALFTMFSAQARPGGAVVDGAELIVAGIEGTSLAPEDEWLEAGLPRLLTSSLIRQRVPNVADPSRVRATARAAGLGDAKGQTDGGAAMLVARRLHAATLVSGEVTRGGGQYLLDLVIRDVATGSVRDRISVTDTSLFGLVDRATARLLAVVDRPAGAFRFEGVETSSVEAYRTYILALDRLDAGRETEAIQLLDAAVSADSTFAAALRTRMLSLTSWTSAAQDSLRRLRDALARLQSRESDFDRRALAAVNASQQGDATRAERIARDLAQRYPRDARAQRSLISDLLNLGEFSEASRVATQALALDSAARAPGRESCATCALYGALVTTALALGDAPRAEAAARSAVAANPSEPAPWGWLSRAAEASGLHAEATSAAQEAMRLAPREASTAEAFGWLMLETGQLAVVDSLIRAWVRPGSELASIGLDLTGALLRERGEYSAAARANARAVARARSEDDSAALGLVYASSLARTGDITAARRMFEQAGHVGDSTRGSRRVLTPTLIARAFAWPHALLADALFLAGSRDTLLLLALADSIETLGSRSSLARDGRLHFHVRGLVAEIGGRWPEAERAFEQARWGRAGWTRTNVELARAQLAQGRPRNAIMTLQEKRFGSLDGMGRYAPYSEINAALAEAFLAAHLPDSARAYAAKVRPAWANADAPQRHRLSAIEQALRDASSR